MARQLLGTAGRRGLAAWSLTLWILCGCGLSAAQLPVLTKAAQIRELLPEAADRGYPVRLRATVTFNLPAGFLLFVQDDTAGVYISTDRRTPFRAGQLLEITGVTSRGDLHPIVVEPQFRVIGESKLPAALPVGVDRFLAAETDCRRVQLEGVVRRVSQRPEPLTLFLSVDGRMVEAVVAEPPDPRFDLSTLVDAAVAAKGVTITRTRGAQTQVRLGVPTLESLEVLRPGAPVDQLPVERIGDVRRRCMTFPTPHRVRLRGVVVEEWAHDRPLSLRDDTGTASVRTIQFPVVRVGDRLEAAGFVVCSPDQPGILLEDAEIRYQPPNVAGATPGGGRRGAFVSSVAELRALEPAQVAARRPVRLTGVVTLFTRIWDLLFVQDQTGAVFVRLSDPYLRLAVGQVVEVEGVSAPGDYAPIIEAKSVRVLGKSGLPPAPPRSYEQLFSGREDCLLVEFAGLVRQVEFIDGVYHLYLDSKGGRVEVLVFDDREPDPAPENLEDLVVRVRGVCVTVVNAKGQMVGVRLFLQRFADLQVLESGAVEPFHLPLTRIRDVLRFAAAEEGRRRRVLGTVSFASGRLVYVYDDSGALKVLSRRETELQVGDLVEVVGYPVPGQPRPILEDAKVRRLGAGVPPPLVELSPGLGPQLEVDGQVIRVNGWLLATARLDGALLMTLQSDGAVFHAEIAPERAGGLSAVPENSQLQLTGVYSVLLDEQNHPRGFKVLLRDPADVVLLQRPPLISAGQAVLALLGLGLIVLVVLGWVYVLRNRIQRQEERFRKAFEAAPMSLHMVTVGEGRIVDANDSFLKLWGYSRDQVIGRTEEELGLWADTGQREALGQTALSGARVRDHEIRLRTSGGQIRNVLLSAERVELEGVRCFLLLCHDITERLSLEEQLRQAQKMESVGRLAAGVAHDFNNLLTVIQGHAQLLLAEPELPPAMADSLRLIEQSAIRGAGFTRQLLTFSRKQVVQRCAVDLLKVIRGMGDMLRRLLGEGIWLEIKGPAQLQPIDADPAMIEQMIMNLAVNARDAMPEGGTLTISVEEVDGTALDPESAAGSRRPLASQGTPRTCVAVSVADTGVGMPPEILPHIFDPFFTTKEVGKGTGLGLATVYGIVKQHSGRIEVESREGMGTTFRIFLPAGTPLVETAEQAGPSAVVQGQGEIILVVEDEISVRRLVAGLLKRRGFQVIEAASGPEALRVWQQNWRDIRLLLSDMVMPGGMTGLDLARNFRRERPDLPVVLTTGYSEKMMAPEIQELERVEFLAKPFQPGELVGRIRSCLSGATPPVPETLQPSA